MACHMHVYVPPVARVLHRKLATEAGRASACPCHTSVVSLKTTPWPTNNDDGFSLNCISNSKIPCKALGFVSFHAFLLSCIIFRGRFVDVEAARAAGFGLEFVSTDSHAEQQVEPSKGNCATCIGVVDETLGACGAVPNCVSTFDDRPPFFIAPWEFPGNLSAAFKQLQGVLGKEGGNIVEEGERYIHAVFIDKTGTIDDVEFLFSIPSEDATVNIRSASRKFSETDYARNEKRLTKIRQTLMWEEVPVLRNRMRKLFFLESPWDTFGPEPPPAFDYNDKLEFVPD